MGKNVGIIDCDLLSRNKHRFPNLACMKISAYYKNEGHNTELVTSWEKDLSKYDKVLVSKVFTDTYVPEIKHDNIKYGGTGFYFDKAAPLPDRIEHCFPDYTLYYNYIKQFPYSKKLRKQFEAYIDYSIGFLTRGCFRKCKFCVNQNYNRVLEHSPLSEFYDPDMKEVKESFNTWYPTWIIAFCPDTNSFFVTNKRHFFWQSEEEFNSENDGINYFEHNISYFIDIANKIIHTDKVWLDNTSKWYEL